jgi:hypothetical protein
MKNKYQEADQINLIKRRKKLNKKKLFQKAKLLLTKKVDLVKLEFLI